MKKVLAIFIIGLFLLGPVIGPAHALYTVPLPTNTLFADDFEGYTQGQKIGFSDTGIVPDGWGWIDNNMGTTGVINITGPGATNGNWYTCCHSLMTTSSSANNDGYDIDKRFFGSPTTNLVSVSMWFALNPGYVGDVGNNAHISFEKWGVNGTGAPNTTPTTNTCPAICGARYEAPVFLLSVAANPSGPCVGGAGAEIDAIGATTIGFGGTGHIQPNQCLTVYSTGSTRRAVWHHYYAVFDIVKYQWNDLQIDGVELKSLVCPTSCLFFSNHNAASNNQNGDDVGFCCAGPIISPTPLRFEIGSFNAVTHTTLWWAWHDDLIISDVSPNPPNIIQLGLVGYSAWIPLIMAMAGVNTTLSTWSLVIRLLKKNDGSALRGLLVAHTKMIVGMNIAVVAFLVVLVIGSIYLPGTCPAGVVCKG